MTTKQVDITNLKKEIIGIMDTGYDADKKICIEILNCINRNIAPEITHPQPEYIITEELLSELYEHTDWGMTNWKKFKDKLHPYQSERDTVHTPIICLCGSTRFTGDMLIKQWELTKQGYIVVSWCALPDDYYKGESKAHIGDQEGVKLFVDEIHKRKIDISDEVLVIDIDGYVGESTQSEINYAIKRGKPVRYLSEELRQKAGEQG